MSPNLPVPNELPDSRNSPETDLTRYQDQPLETMAEDEGLNLGRAKSALFRFKWLVIAVTILGTGAGWVFSRGMKPMYTGGTSIWIDQGARYGGAQGPIQAPRMFDGEGWVELVKSFVVLDSVARDLHLNVSFVPPVDRAVAAQFGLAEQFSPGVYRLRIDSTGRKYALIGRDGAQLESGSLGDSVGMRLGIKWAPPPNAFSANQEIQIGVGSIRNAAVNLRGNLVVGIDQVGSILKLSLSDTDPAKLAAILNAVSQRFTVVASNLKRQNLTELSKILAGQVEYARRELTDAEQALKNYQERTIMLPGRAAAGRVGASTASADNSTGDAAASGYFGMQVELSEIQHERDEIRRLLASPDSDLSVSAFERINAVKQSSNLTQALQELTKKRADLRALSYTYSDEHPEVKKLRAQIASLEHTTIPGLARDVDNVLGSRAGYLDRQVVSKGANLLAIPANEIEGARLQRAVALAERLYTSAQTKYQETQVAEASSAVPDVRTLDQAVAPGMPSKDTRARILMIALLGSLGLGSAGALLLDRVDSRFRYPDQVSRDMGLTILGAIPHAKGASDLMDRAVTNAPLQEALRAVRLNLVYAYGTAGPMVFTITSPGRSEGKTFLTAQLARVFAENGQRTLVVEGDLRKGVLHRRLNLVRRPGLSDYLRGDASIDQIVQKTKFQHLDVITAGTRFHHAPELLGTHAMVQLLAALRSRFDVILCDSPPLGAGIDPLVLGTATGNLLMVLRTGVSHRELTEAKLEVISRMPIRLLGAVLNDVPKDAVFSYYSYYLPGYETSDEEKPSLPSAKQLA
jgi:succinoglycan biosynthesis transport protein ExoP